ncbi:MAG TPA: hypothetical protein VIF09_19835 [Polyangiaceae bacterium]
MAALHSLSLVIHLACLAVFGASSLGGLVLDRRLWASLERGSAGEALALAQTGMLLGRFAQLASVLTLLTGLGMLASTGWVQWGQLWLYGKIVLFFALAGYGGAVGGRAGRRLVAALTRQASSAPAAGAKPIDGELAGLRSTFATFHVVMPLMLLGVLVLVVVRP